MNAVADVLRNRGAAIVRQAISPEQLRPVFETAREYFTELIRSGEPRTRYGGVTIQKIMTAGYPQIELMLDLIAGSPILTAIEAYYEDQVVVPLHHMLLRYYHPTIGEYGHISPFHQDITGVDRRAAVTSWFPLNPCGTNAPGLEIVDAKVAEIACGDDMKIDPTFVISRYGAHLLHPPFEPGDAALFTQTTVHRTYVTPEMTGARYSIECRYIPKALLMVTEAAPVFHRLDR
jgi:hypothetical protein